MESPETTPFDDGLSQNHSSPDYLPPPNNQLQHGSELKRSGILDNSVLSPEVGCPVKTNPATYQGKQLEDILSNFVPFDIQTKIKVPWEANAECDDAYIQGVFSLLWCIYPVESKMDDVETYSEQFAEFMELIIEVWAWNVARVKFTTETGSERLGGQLCETMAAEEKQGMSGSLVTSKPASLRMATRVCTDIFVEMCLRVQDFVAKMKLAINALRGL